MAIGYGFAGQNIKSNFMLSMKTVQFTEYDWPMWGETIHA